MSKCRLLKILPRVLSVNIEESNRYKLRVPVNKYSNSRILNDFPDNLHTTSRIEVYGAYGGCRWP